MILSRKAKNFVDERDFVKKSAAFSDVCTLGHCDLLVLDQLADEEVAAMDILGDGDTGLVVHA